MKQHRAVTAPRQAEPRFLNRLLVRWFAWNATYRTPRVLVLAEKRPNRHLGRLPNATRDRAPEDRFALGESALLVSRPCRARNELARRESGQDARLSNNVAQRSLGNSERKGECGKEEVCARRV